MIRLLTVVAVLAGVGTAHASDWSGFYAGPSRAEVEEVSRAAQAPTGQGEAGVCVRAILAAQERYGIPNNILLGIGLQEAGTRRGGALTVWPWAVNAEGTGRLLDTRSQAMSWVRAQLANGVRSIDVGCMQINLRWHPDAFASLEDGFDPDRNADYAARFLRDLYQQTGSWTLAAGSYHSFTPEKRDRYLASLRQKVLLANQEIGALRQLSEATPGPTRDVVVARAVPDGGAIWSSSLSGAAGAQAGGLFGTGAVTPLMQAPRPTP
ncbi:MAG: lytic transglycosylase domain-containing protein [Pseudomonadota bacterium]